MRRLIITLTALGGLAWVPTPAMAEHRSHARLHADLGHRDFHRSLYHREAHRYPMSWRGHERLHDELDHDAFHDGLRHNLYHRSRYYHSPYHSYSGFGFHGRGFSIWFGR